ncbi:MAG: 50S ribosomal protein L27, partial [Saprospiraceae bacterium]|nr:50S ribosomal protein L27 [Saprospiraceae bacterium]
ARESATAFGAASVAAAALAAVPEQIDDLKKVEGIGPKIEQLCNQIGIWTFAALASSPLEKLKDMLEKAGPAYKIADPATWPRQAELAAAGSWDELKIYQDFLSGGKNPGA